MLCVGGGGGGGSVNNFMSEDGEQKEQRKRNVYQNCDDSIFSEHCCLIFPCASYLLIFVNILAFQSLDFINRRLQSSFGGSL